MPVPAHGHNHAATEMLAEEMLKLYEEAERTLLTSIKSRLARGIENHGWYERKLSEVTRVKKDMQSVVNKLSKERRRMVKQHINNGYSVGQLEFISDKNVILEGIPAITPNVRKAAAILLETQTLLDNADRVILRNANDIYTTVIGRATATVANGTLTLRQAVQNALDDFARKGITSFVDKSGSNWEMSTYAEMAILTGVSKATIQGYTDSMQEFGYDLAIISSHAGACPLCVAWEDVIVSISGTHPDYPALDDAISDGLFHPRCVHDMSTYHEGITRPGRTEPKEVDLPSEEYTTRSKQRYMERQIRQWKRRTVSAVDPKAERYSYNHVRKWQTSLRDLLRKSDNFLPRKYAREGGRIKLSDEALSLRQK